MSDGARLVGFGAVLALALAIGLGIGAAVGPLGSGDGAHQQRRPGHPRAHLPAG